MLFVVFLAIILVAAAAHVAIVRPSSRHRAAELILVYLLVGYYGVCMLFAAFIHLTKWPALDALKGWPAAGTQMHTLYAFALLGLAFSSLLSIRLRGVYVLGPSLTGAVLSFGGAIIHVREMSASGRFILGRDGPEILFDVIVPLFVLVLAVLHVVHSSAKASGA
jgi:uncharacterized protein DUF6790